MKVRVAIPEEIWRRHDSADLEQEFIDDILLWGMETELDVAFYTTVTDYEFPGQPRWNSGRRLRKWAVFTVEAENTFMFTLKWNALLHKNKVAA